MPYFRLLDRIHQTIRPRTYLEIGVSTGGSFTLSLPGTIDVGIDPEPKIANPIGTRAQIFWQTSDAFFASHDLRDVLGGRDLDLAFVDGMHHFEVALRDFMHIERQGTTRTTVLVHDCYPIDEASASRTRCQGKWSGDVWRLIVCLKEHRPDLTISVVDVGPTGLGVITGLDPASSVLAEKYDQLVAHYLDLPYAFLQEGDKASILNRTPGDWETVRSLLPAHPFRTEPLASLVTRRAIRAWWPAARRAARRKVATVRPRPGEQR